MKTFGLIAALSLALNATAGIQVHTAETPFQNGPQQIYVLKPDTYTTNKLYRVLYVLPVGRGGAARELKIFEEMNSHNAFDLIVVGMTFEKTPWFGDHPTDPKTRQSSYVKDWLVPFVESHYSTLARQEGRLLFGFSKSGWGAFSMIFRNPEFYGFAAAWDSPMMLPDFHYGMDQVFGTLENLQNYRPDLLVPRAKDAFQAKTRLVFAGEDKWGNLIPSPAGGTHTTDFRQLLLREKIKHEFIGDLKTTHTWSRDWMEPTLAALMRVAEEAGELRKSKSVVDLSR